MVKSSSQSKDRDTEQRILAAAHVVFVRRGTAGARMQEIAKEADVNSALLHYYFRSKDRLAEAVFQRAAMQLLPAVIRILGSDAELEAKVEQVVDVELKQLQSMPYLPGYVLSELTHHPERVGQLFSTVMGLTPAQVGARVFKLLGAQINEGGTSGRMHSVSTQ